MELDFKTNMFSDCTGEAERLEDEGRKEVRSPLRVVSDGSLPLRSNKKTVTPLKINMEHTHVGLEADFPF